MVNHVDCEESPVESIVSLIREFVRIPSRGGIDSYGSIISACHGWLKSKGLAPEVVSGSKSEGVAVLCTIGDWDADCHFVLNAPLDTAPFGDEEFWEHSPTSGVVREGWLFGRGSADCKAAMGIFSHLAVELASAESLASDRAVTLLFDGDEHTGTFTGVKEIIPECLDPESVGGVFIGYPGNDKVVVGCRGFWRGYVHVFGTGGHSGGSSPTKGNAVVKAAEVVTKLRSTRLSSDVENETSFGLPPKVTATGIEGGEGFSMVPDHCVISVDVRVTPSFTPSMAEEFVQHVVEEVDSSYIETPRSRIEAVDSVEAYKMNEEERIVAALRNNVRKLYGKNVATRVVGPSSIGNYLASLGVPATSGYGVNYQNIHAPNEGIEIASIPEVYNVYRGALLELVSGRERTAGS